MRELALGCVGEKERPMAELAVGSIVYGFLALPCVLLEWAVLSPIKEDSFSETRFSWRGLSGRADPRV